MLEMGFSLGFCEMVLGFHVKLQSFDLVLHTADLTVSAVTPSALLPVLSELFQPRR